MSFPLVGAVLGIIAYFLLFHDSSSGWRHRGETALSREGDWRDSMEAARSASEAGDVEQEERMLLRALELAESLGVPMVCLAVSLSALARFRASAGEHAIAGSLFLRALKVTRETAGEHHIQTAVATADLAWVQSIQGLTVAAEDLYARSIEIAEEADESGSAVLFNVLTSLGEMRQMHGDSAGATDPFKRAFDICRKETVPCDPAYMAAVVRLTDAYVGGYMYDEAESLNKWAMDDAQTRLDSKHRCVGIYAHNLATVVHVQGRDDEAELLFERALTMHREAVDGLPIDAVFSYTGLARVYWVQGRLDEADALCTRALEIATGVVDADSPAMVELMQTIAGIHGVQGRRM